MKNYRGTRRRNVENNNKDCTEVEGFPSAMPAQDLTVTYRDRIKNAEVLLRTGSRKLADTVAERRFRIAGHILHLPSHRPSNVAMSWTPDDGRRRRGRPKKTWCRTFQEDLTRANISWEEAEHTAMDRPLWRQAATQCAYWQGRN